MADLLSTGVSGLIAFQSALATTGHNISNVNTPGYSRQRVDLATRIPEPSGAGFFGTGVQAVSIERLFDQFANEQLRIHTSLDSYLETFHDFSSRVDNILADPDAGLSPALQSFFDSLQGVTDNPSSISARQVLLSEAGSLVERFRSIYSRFDALRDAVNTRLESLVTEINAFAASIAELNGNIRLARDLSGGQQPNDLLDQRDELLRQLSERVPVSTVEQDDGSVNVFIGNGQTLVLGTKTQEIGITNNPYSASCYEIAVGSDGSGPIVSKYIQGGELGGVLAFRDEILLSNQNALGRIAMAITQTMNDQHRQGLDLNGLLGGDFFSEVGLDASYLTAASNVNNHGTAVVSFVVDDVTRLTTSDYLLKTTDGISFTLTRVSDNRVVDSFAPGAYPATYTSASEGLTIRIASAPEAGDSWQLEPTRGAARDLTLAIDDARDIAAAGPIRAIAAAANLGDGLIGAPETLDISDPDFFTTTTLLFGSSDLQPPLGNAGAPPPAGTDPTVDLYSIDGGATWAALPADNVFTMNGWTVAIKGTPQAGDTFTIARNDDAVGDNRNAVALTGLQQLGILENNTNSFHAAYAQMVSGVGARTHQLDINSQAQQTILNQATQTRDAVSGVNLDEEAANLVRFQQAYQATAQVINAAHTLFQTLLDAVR